MIKIFTQKKIIWMLCFVSISSISAQTIINCFFPKQNEFTFATSYAYKSYDRASSIY